MLLHFYPLVFQFEECLPYYLLLFFEQRTIRPVLMYTAAEEEEESLGSNQNVSGLMKRSLFSLKVSKSAIKRMH